MNNGMLHQSLEVGVRPLGMAPVSTGDQAPPGQRFTAIHRWRRRQENNRFRNLLFRRKIRVQRWIRGPFRNRLIAGGLNELLKLGVGDRCLIDLK